jgi:sugar phosphate isomerase/epimerase
MRLAIIDYHLRQPDHKVCAQAKAWGFPAVELTRSAILADRRWLNQHEGAGRWYSAAMALGITLESLSATFAYEWTPVDRQGRIDTTSIEALEALIETAGYLNISCVHIPLLEAKPPRTGADVQQLHDVLSCCVEKARLRQIHLCVESYWPAELQREFCEREPGTLQVSFDVGNCIALGRDPAFELEMLGHHVGQVRVRDRRRHEIFRSLPLGHGDVDWSAVQQQVVKLSRRPQLVLAATGGASLIESHASASRLLYQLVSEPQFSRVA